jgi:hypothetical protein
MPPVDDARDRDPDRRYSVEEYRRMVADLAGTTRAKAGTSRRKPKPALRLPKETRSMGIAAVLARVLHFPPLSRLTLQPEETIAVAFAHELRAATMEGRLRAVWTHPANEIAGRRSGLSKIRYAIAKAMGLIYGTPDYVFLASHRSGALEAKVPGNRQQDNQKDFERWCLVNGVAYRVFTSVEEGLAILEEWGMLTRDREKGRETLAAWETIGASAG